MKRLAVFAEGETEQSFVDWLVQEMAGTAHLRIQKRKARGGQSTRRRTRIVEAVADDPDLKYYVLIVDCGGDGGVKSRILDEYENLRKKGYRSIIGLRDGPKFREDIERLRDGLSKGLPVSPMPVLFVLAIMEIESWFLSEYTHLSKIDLRLTPAFVYEQLGFDPSSDDMRLRDRPAEDLNAIYQLAGQSYRKGRAAQRTVFNLDCARFVMEMNNADPDIDRLVSTVEEFLGGSESCKDDSQS